MEGDAGFVVQSEVNKIRYSSHGTLALSENISSLLLCTFLTIRDELKLTDRINKIPPLVA